RIHASKKWEYLSGIKPTSKKYALQKYQDIINSYYAVSSLEDAPDLHEGLDSHWMHDYKKHLANKKLTEMVLPGTHDAAAYRYDPSFNLFPHSTALRALNFFAKIMPPLKSF